MDTWRAILLIVIALGLTALLVRRAITANAVRRAMPEMLFGKAAGVLDDPEFGYGEAVGSYTLSGVFNGHPVQVKTVTDTLAVRKLPSLWLMVTIPEALPVTATFDMMMRPAGPTTFSNFDQLGYTLELPPGFPEDAVIRSDDPAHILNSEIILGHARSLLGARGKELLITPKGLRVVILLAEADRLRYGVFRQADFGGIALDPELLRWTIAELLALRTDIGNWHRGAA